MQQPERGPGGPRPPERETPSPERDLPCYHQGARFAGEDLAEATYLSAQNIVFAHVGDVDLSAYRFQLNRVDHVVIMGESPWDSLLDSFPRASATTTYGLFPIFPGVE